MATRIPSGSKYVTADGVSAVKDGVRPQADAAAAARPRKPGWLRVRVPSGAGYLRVKEIVRSHRLATVCEESHCPNIGECWSAGTATLMLLGAVCTRACRFCAVDTGNPQGRTDPDEPAAAAESVVRMGLRYVVLTSVDRDDLPDGGAAHFAATIAAIRRRSPETAIEALTPDFRGDHAAIATVARAGLQVFAQNLETVERLTHPVRDPRAGYRQTLAVLAHAKKVAPDVLTKSSLMLGLGERDDEVLTAMDDLRAAGVELLALGQYLQPTPNHLPIDRYVSPEAFLAFRQAGLRKGFKEVAAGPLVRSSYRAERALEGSNLGLTGAIAARAGSSGGGEAPASNQLIPVEHVR